MRIAIFHNHCFKYCYCCVGETDDSLVADTYETIVYDPEEDTTEQEGNALTNTKLSMAFSRPTFDLTIVILIREAIIYMLC